MKYFTFSLLMLLCMSSCSRQNIIEQNSIKTAIVEFSKPSQCCSNMELVDEQPVYSDIVEYSETKLDAINLEDFDSQSYKNMELLEIEYSFTSPVSPCPALCVREPGIPIKIISIRRI